MEILYSAYRPVSNPVVSIAIYTSGREHLTTFNSRTSAVAFDTLNGDGAIFCRIKNLPFGAGSYYLSVAFHDYGCVHTYDYHHLMYEFEVECDERWSEGPIYVRGEWAESIDFQYLLDGNESSISVRRSTTS
jgi:hypothetical protein